MNCFNFTYYRKLGRVVNLIFSITHLFLREVMCVSSSFLGPQLMCIDATSYSNVMSCRSYSSCFQRSRGKTGPPVCRLGKKNLTKVHTPRLTSTLPAEGLL